MSFLSLLKPKKATKVLFLDRDGTLIEEGSCLQINEVSEIRFTKGVVIVLKQFVEAGYELVMVSNQDGLGSEQYLQSDFDKVQDFILQTFSSQGIFFKRVFVNAHFAHENSPMRKPNVGMVLDYLKNNDIDKQASLMIGDRPTDALFAKNLGIESFSLVPNDKRNEEGLFADEKGGKEEGLRWQEVQTTFCRDWFELLEFTLCSKRKGVVCYETKETSINCKLTLEGSGVYQGKSGLHFFDHMLSQLACHSLMDLELEVKKNDLHVDEHHLIEDTAICLGACFLKALGDKKGINRYGFYPEVGFLTSVSLVEREEQKSIKKVAVMDESVSACALDVSGRAFLVFEGSFSREYVGDFPTEMLKHFFDSFSKSAGVSLHLTLKGDNMHHKIEASFKAFAKALASAVTLVSKQLPSTKGVM